MGHQLYILPCTLEICPWKLPVTDYSNTSIQKSRTEREVSDNHNINDCCPKPPGTTVYFTSALRPWYIQWLEGCSSGFQMCSVQKWKRFADAGLDTGRHASGVTCSSACWSLWRDQYRNSAPNTFPACVYKWRHLRVSSGGSD